MLEHNDQPYQRVSPQFTLLITTNTSGRCLTGLLKSPTHPVMHQYASGATQVLFAGVLWGASGTIASFFPQSASPFAIGAILLAVGGICLAIILGITSKGVWFAPNTKIYSKHVFITTLGSALAQDILFLGVKLARVTIATMVGIGSPPLIAEPHVLELALALGGIAAALPYFLFNTGMRYIPVPHAYLYESTEPLTASMLGMLLLKERLSLSGMMGYGLISAGLLLFTI